MFVNVTFSVYVPFFLSLPRAYGLVPSLLAVAVPLACAWFWAVMVLVAFAYVMLTLIHTQTPR